MKFCRGTLSPTKNDWNVNEVIGSFKELINQTDKQSGCCSAFLLLFQFPVKSKQTSLVVRKIGRKFLAETFLLIILTISKSFFQDE